MRETERDNRERTGRELMVLMLRPPLDEGLTLFGVFENMPKLKFRNKAQSALSLYLRLLLLIHENFLKHLKRNLLSKCL